MREVTEADLRAADGRVPGRRGRATRARLLECTGEMLASTSFRELRVIDIARGASTSPATFYQYFPDVESAILVLAEQMAAETSTLADHVREGPWKGKAAYGTALSLSDHFFDFWERHRSLLRVVDLASAEGDLRFTKIRSRLLNELTCSLRDAMLVTQPKHSNEPVEPMAMAGVLVAMLSQVASHRYGFEFWGIRTSDTRHALAHLIHWGVVGQRPRI